MCYYKGHDFLFLSLSVYRSLCFHLRPYVTYIVEGAINPFYNLGGVFNELVNI
jgi:hypothetical protein